LSKLNEEDLLEVEQLSRGLQGLQLELESSLSHVKQNYSDLVKQLLQDYDRETTDFEGVVELVEQVFKLGAYLTERVARNEERLLEQAAEVVDLQKKNEDALQEAANHYKAI